MQPGFEFTDDQKRAFAAALLRMPGQTWNAAVAVFGPERDKVGQVLWAANNWPNDPVVELERQRLMSAEEVGSTLPTKEQIQRKLWDFATGAEYASKEKIDAIRLLAELQGHVTRSGAAAKGANAPAVPPAIIFELDEDDDVTAGDASRTPTLDQTAA